jgi:hypothetical protein
LYFTAITLSAQIGATHVDRDGMLGLTAVATTLLCVAPVPVGHVAAAIDESANPDIGRLNSILYFMSSSAK